MSRVFALSLLALTLFLSGCAGVGSLSGNNPDTAKPQVHRQQRNHSLHQETQADLLNVNTNDLWQRVRAGFDIPDPDLPIIINHASQLAENPEYINRLMQRSSPYLYYIVEEVEARDMPTELALLPFVESAFDPKALSPAKASGIWQFMPATGKNFNLTQNMFRDERRDIIQSTRAALDYLQRLYKIFGDWPLALAAYNWGEGSVTRAIKKNQAAGLPTDYYSLTLPNETRNYVPKLLAYKRLIDHPKSYGFVLPKLENHPYFVAAPIYKDIDVDLAIQLSEISREEFLSLNPSFTKPVILSAASTKILLPYGNATIFQDNLNAFKKPLSSWTAVWVEKTDTVDKLASTLKVDPVQLRELNSIPRGMKIKAGSTVLIPKSPLNDGNVSLHLADNAALDLEREVAPTPLNCRSYGKRRSCASASPILINNRMPVRDFRKLQKVEKKSPPAPKNEGKSRGKKVQGNVKTIISQR